MESFTLKEIRRRIEDAANKLSVPHKRFCDEYLANGNIAYKAYLAVFFTNNKNVASKSSTRLMKKAAVKEYIGLCKKFTTAELLDHLSVTQNRILDEEAKIAFTDPRNFFGEDGQPLQPHEWPDDIARSVAGIEIDQKWDPVNEKWMYKYKVKFNDKGRALGRLETVLGMNKQPEMTDKDSDLFKGFLDSIDGKSRGVLPSEMEEEDED